MRSRISGQSNKLTVVYKDVNELYNKALKPQTNLHISKFFQIFIANTQEIVLMDLC